MTPNERLGHLAKESSGDIVVEVGTASGSSAKAIMRGLQDSDKWFFTVDPYGEKPYRAGKQLTSIKYGESEFRKAMTELYDFAEEKGVFYTHWRMRSLDFIEMLPGIQIWKEGGQLENIRIGLLFLDGEHTLEMVKREIDAFYKYIIKGGAIVIDDINFLGMEEGVKKLFSGRRGDLSFETIESCHRSYFIKR